MSNVYRVSWTYMDAERRVEGYCSGYCEAASKKEAVDLYYEEHSRFLVMEHDTYGSKENWWYNRPVDPDFADVEAVEIQEYDSIDDIVAESLDEGLVIAAYPGDYSPPDVFPQTEEERRARFYEREFDKHLYDEQMKYQDYYEKLLETSPGGVSDDVSSAGPEGEVSNV